MSTFQVQPDTPYNISIGQPGVAGTPSPTITYAWTYNGTAIGDNSRFVTSYVFPSFPGTLACTITLTNIVGSVSQTVTASIQQVSNLPTLSPVTIRNNAAQTVPISTIANGNAGVVLRVGGPTAPDINPVSSNATTVSYQWRRGAVDIAGATSQTYTLAAADEDATISVVVTAANLDGSTSRTTAIAVGAPPVRSPIGDHYGYHDYFSSGPSFANLMHASINGTCGVGSSNFLGRGVAGRNPAEDLRFRTSDWTNKPEICTEDGWLKGSFNGPLSNSNDARVLFSAHHERTADVLQLPWSWEGPPPRAEYTGQMKDVKLRVADNLNGRKFQYTMNVYWEGTGYIHPEFYNRSTATTRETPTLVTFANDPFAMGRTGVQMWKVSQDRTWTVSNENFFVGVSIEESDPNDPVRNVVALITDVREVLSPGSATEPPVLGEVTYVGYDETNYTPFALYPTAKQRFQQAKVMRTVQLGYAHATQEEYSNSLWARHVTDVNGNDLVFEYYNSSKKEHAYPVWESIVSPSKHPCGTELGLEATCRPTHVCVGNSLRAMIEICNQCDCDLWWCHPFYAITVATEVDGELVYPLQRSLAPDASNPNQTGYLRVDPAYADWFVTEIQRLKPGLKVYSEYVNELWNNKIKFAVPYMLSYVWSQKAKADPQFGGDNEGIIRGWSTRTVGATGVFAGTTIPKANRMFGPLISALGSALLAKELRDRDISCELVCVAGGWFQQPGEVAPALETAFATQPYLVRELDALSTAPYRGAETGLTRPPGYETAQRAVVWHDVYGSTEAMWQHMVEVRKCHAPITDPQSWWNALSQVHLCRAYKNIALDVAYPDDGRTQFVRKLPVGWDSSRRRWNLKLVAYECGVPTQPVSDHTKVPDDIEIWAYERTPEFSYDPRNRLHARRYYEMLFQPWTKGLATDPQAGTQDALLYRLGTMPAGIVENAEPMYEVVIDLINTQEFNGAVVWSNQATTTHDAPAQQGRIEAISRGVGLPNWWVGYDYGD